MAPAVSGGPDPTGAEGTPPHPGICAVCPICQGFEGLRQARPELAEHLATAAAALLAAVREMLNTQPSTAEAGRHPRAGPTEPAEDAGDQPAARPGVPVERIDVTD